MRNRQQDMGGADGVGECVFSVRIEDGLAHLSISMNDTATTEG